MAKSRITSISSLNMHLAPRSKDLDGAPTLPLPQRPQDWTFPSHIPLLSQTWKSLGAFTLRRPFRIMTSPLNTPALRLTLPGRSRDYPPCRSPHRPDPLNPLRLPDNTASNCPACPHRLTVKIPHRRLFLPSRFLSSTGSQGAVSLAWPGLPLEPVAGRPGHARDAAPFKVTSDGFLFLKPEANPPFLPYLLTIFDTVSLLFTLLLDGTLSWLPPCLSGCSFSVRAPPATVQSQFQGLLPRPPSLRTPKTSNRSAFAKFKAPAQIQPLDSRLLHLRVPTWHLHGDGQQASQVRPKPDAQCPPPPASPAAFPTII